MARRSTKKGREVPDIAAKNFEEGFRIISQHPMFAPLVSHACEIRQEKNLCPGDGWAIVTTSGFVHVHPTRRGTPEEWVYVLAHCLLHLGFGHFQTHKRPIEWNTACDCFAAKFLADLKLGCPPKEIFGRLDFSTRSEESLYEDFCQNGIPEDLRRFGTAGSNFADMIFGAEKPWHKTDWPACFGAGLSNAVKSAVEVAAGYAPFLGSASNKLTEAQKARNWFISSYPLLGALAASFQIIEDQVVCMRLDISVAAVDETAKEIFLNPGAGLDVYECRFVVAHELLHVGLRHQGRCGGRDSLLWNIACDFVINGWLVEMGLGELPKRGVLYDPDLKGLSAEAIYDRIVADIRRFRKLATLRGTGLGDMLARGKRDWWATGEGIRLDDFYRRALCQGMFYHQDQCRGFLPAGLVEEIRALGQPPILWDVALAQWFDGYFSPLEKVRSYARPSRKQSATPDIPRPRYVPAFGAEDGRTFGVILDTSGSMERAALAKALGAIASYSISRDVPLVRVVFCDAVAYDQGYMLPEAIADRVQVKGRGGTILQPGIDLLEGAEDFPQDAPLLVITDGCCDRLHIKREHAFILPEGGKLPFVPKGKVFRFK